MIISMEITLTELLTGSGITIGTIATAVITAYNKLSSKISSMETDITYLKKELTEEKRENKHAFENLTAQMQKLFDVMVEIKVEMQNKRNRNE